MNLLHWESEVSVREGLVAEGEMPPLGVEGLEAVTEHGLAEDHAVGKLLSGDGAASRRLGAVARIFARLRIAAEVGMTLRTEPVEGATHVEFLLRLHVEKGQVEG